MAGAAAGRAVQKGAASAARFIADEPQSQETPLQIGKDVALTGVLQGIGARGVKGGARMAAGAGRRTEQMAVDEVNALLKPRASIYLYGKNPGKGVIDEGITGKSFKEIAPIVQQKLDQVGALSPQIPAAPKNKGKMMSISGFMAPLDRALAEVRKAPHGREALIKRLEDLKLNLGKGYRNEMTGELLLPHKFNRVSPKTALEIKRLVGELTDFTGSKRADDTANSALREIYHFIDSKLDATLPEMKRVNERYANLLGAHVAARSRDLASMNRRELLPMAEVAGGMVLGTALGHPIQGAIGGLATATTHKVLSSPTAITNMAQGAIKYGVPVANATVRGIEAAGQTQVPQTLIRKGIEEDPLGLFTND